MNPPTEKQIISSGFTRFIQDFEKAGDGIPMHAHGEKDVHISVCSRGSFRVRGPEIGDFVIKAGADVDFGLGILHEIIALEDNSRLHNFRRSFD